MTAPLEAVAIGAGGRGYGAYAPYALEHPDELRFATAAISVDTGLMAFAAESARTGGSVVEMESYRSAV
jgi:hypothetical protein